MKHIFTSGGRVQKLSPMIPKCIPILGVTFVQKFKIFKDLVEEGKQAPIWAPKVPLCRNPTLAKCGGEAQHLEKVRIWSPPRLPNV
jgi:hypothetical protein